MASLDNSQELDTSNLVGEYEEEHSDNEECEDDKEEASKREEDESGDDEHNHKEDEGEAKPKTRYRIENDDDEFDLMKYTGTCDKCKGRTCPDVDHIEDLVARAVSSKHRFNTTHRLQYHWPHFADFNRLMQFICPICKLHFRGAGEFTIHTVRNQTEDGFKNDGPEQITWTEEIGVQHQALLKTFILLIKDIDSNGPKAEQIPIIDKFLCCNGQRYFEVAHRQGKFAEIPLPNMYDYEEDYMTHMEYEFRLVTNDNPEAFKIEEVGDSDLLYGADAYTQQLDDVFFGKVGKLSDITEKQDADCVNGVKKVKRDDKISPKKTSEIRDGYKCPECSESSPSVRHHINDAMWATKRNRSRHINYFVKNLRDSDTIVSDYDVKTTTCFYCPACKRHVRTWRAYEFLFNHMKKHASFPKMKPNKFIKDHLDLIMFATDLFIERIKGDLSPEALRAALNEKMICNEGGIYLESDKMLAPTNWQRLKRQHSTSKRRRPGPKRFRPDRGQASKRRAASGSRPGGRGSMRNRGAPVPYGGPMGMGTPYLCDLCGLQTFGQDGLYQHLMEALFRGNRESVRAHLLSFPESFIYNMACKCPGCGQNEANFANCLQHLGRMARRNPQHQVEAEALVNQFLRCMTGAINFNSVTRYLEGSFQMGGRRK